MDFEETFANVGRTLQTVIDDITEATRETARTMKDFANAVNKYKYNNWRKFHHIPMRRRWR